MDLLSNWLVEARNHLNTAKIVCGKANLKLTVINESIDHRNLSLIKTNYYLDSLKQQLQILELIIQSVDLYVISITKQNNSINQSILSNIRALDETLARLDSTTIKISESPGDAETLYDFVSAENINKIKDRLKIIQSNKDKLYRLLLDQYNSLKTALESYTVNYKRIEALMETESENLLDKAVDENKTLEGDLVSILQMLTNHFDQCHKGISVIQSTEINDQQKDQLMEVLKSDVLELPGILNDLEHNYQTIVSNCNKISQGIEKVVGYETSSVELLTGLNEFGNMDLLEIYGIIHEFNKNFLTHYEKVDEEINNIKNLIDYYTNFEKSYYHLVLEIQRRSKTQSKINNIVGDTLNKLKHIEIEETELRKFFIEKNGDYLPSNMWNGLNNPLPFIEMVQHVEDLPVLDEQVVEEAKLKSKLH